MPTYNISNFLDSIDGEGQISRSSQNEFGLEIIKADPIIDAATVAMVKNYYRIDHDTDDAQIERNLRTSLRTIEDYTNRNIITRQVTAQWKRFPRVVNLPCPPQTSITSVKTIADDGVETTLVAGTDYYSYGNQTLTLEITDNNNEQLQVIYQAGYGKNLDAIPTWAQDAVIYQLGIYYSNFDESMGTRVYDAATGLDQRAKSACDGNRFLMGT